MDRVNSPSSTRFRVFGFTQSIVSNDAFQSLDKSVMPLACPFVNCFWISRRPSMLPLSRILFVNCLVSTPYIAGTPCSFNHVPSDDVARKCEQSSPEQEATCEWSQYCQQVKTTPQLPPSWWARRWGLSYNQTSDVNFRGLKMRRQLKLVQSLP